MGYFSNGTEGEFYQERYCYNCKHWPDDPDEGCCPVWLLHLLHNYEECNKEGSYLHILIPRSEDKLSNEQCSMFMPRHPGFHPDQTDMFDD